jgi:myo-inositol-1(or 4)-monophosphatase
MFSACRGQGAYENGRRIHSSRAPLKDSVLLSGSAGFSAQAFQIAQDLTRVFQGRCQGVRTTGSAEYNLCMAASGRTGGYYEMRLGLWDFAAGGLILEEAGGRLTDYYGKPLSWRGPSSVVAVSEGIARENALPDTGAYLERWNGV